jgi:hypothetical protein
MTDIVGTWRLVRAVARDADGNELPVPYGGQGLGRIVFGDDGRMAVMMIDGRKDMPTGEKREYGGYCGTYAFDGKQLITRVDSAPDPSRIGSEQIRGVRFEDGLMVLRPPPRGQGGTLEQRELSWEKISSI